MWRRTVWTLMSSVDAIWAGVSPEASRLRTSRSRGLMAPVSYQRMESSTIVPVTLLCRYRSPRTTARIASMSSIDWPP